jgi:EAL domain-containing protein (putative c-di-GMP-specific phosphodiesterase class I)/GGDEF domain-containing protein
VPAASLDPEVRSLGYRELLAALRGALPCGGSSLALVLLNVTDLCALQARLGFEPSATLLRSLGARFRSALSERGMVLRLGEGSFCILVKAVRNAGHAVLAAERLKHAMEEAMTDASLVIAPEMHLGIALYPQHATEAAGLLRKAQLAAALARKCGARLKVYEPDCEQVVSAWNLADEFAEALRSGSLAVRYQPKVRIADSRPAGVEALLRWLQEGRAVTTPDVFIPLAEEAGLIQETTWYVLSNALRQVVAHRRLPVAVNITPGMLHHPDFMEMVRTAVSTWSVDSGELTLEITEGALIADFEQAIARLTRLRECGVRIAIDDFGTGYSSLSYFKRLSADELKIDKSFVMRMLTDAADQRLVEAIIGLAHQFRVEVVAEGVEDRPTLQALARMGCDYAQGHHLAPALDEEQLTAWLQSSNPPPPPAAR